MSHKKQVEPSSKPETISALRLVLSLLIGLAITVYTFAVILGYIPEERQIDAVDLTTIGLSILSIFLLLKPNTFSRLKRLETGPFNVELYNVKQEIKNIEMMLPLLLPVAERKRLMGFYKNQGTDISSGRDSLRSEIRSLRSLGLVEMQPKRYVGAIKDGMHIKLTDYIKLTNSGIYWANQIIEIEEKSTDKASAK